MKIAADFPVVFIDECGNTGEDLANVDQPVFCLSSIFLSENECKELKEEFFGEVKAKELKHTSLANSGRYRQCVLDFISEISRFEGKIKFSIAHKNFVLLSKIVDLIIEPLMYEEGIDFYKDGANIAYSNLFFQVILSYKSEDYLKRILKRFQQAVRGKTIKAYNEFMGMVRETGLPKPLGYFFASLLHSDMKYGAQAFTKLPGYCLDIAVTSALTLVASWSETIGDEFFVIHDQSGIMKAQKDAWDKIVSPDAEKLLAGQDRRTIQFPINVIFTGFENSRGSCGLQLADVLAGSRARSLKWIAAGKNPSDKYGAALTDAFGDIFDTLSIWPGTEVTPEELGTVGMQHANLIDHIATLLDT